MSEQRREGGLKLSSLKDWGNGVPTLTQWCWILGDWCVGSCMGISICRKVNMSCGSCHQWLWGCRKWQPTRSHGSWESGWTSHTEQDVEVLPSPMLSTGPPRFLKFTKTHGPAPFLHFFMETIFFVRKRER